MTRRRTRSIRIGRRARTVTRRRGRILSRRRSRLYRTGHWSTTLGHFGLFLVALTLFTLEAPVIGAPPPADGGISRAAPPTSQASPAPETPPAVAVTAGVDYSYLDSYRGTPVKWGCDIPIVVQLVGPAPDGADIALSTVTSVLADASGLPLQVDDQAATEHGIDVYYVPLGVTAAGWEIEDPQTMGMGGPRWSGGRITAGTVLIRNDTTMTDPTTTLGQHVLMHELAHALGLGHAAADSAELMAPSSGSDAQPELGPGDMYALEQVGCP